MCHVARCLLPGEAGTSAGSSGDVEAGHSPAGEGMIGPGHWACCLDCPVGEPVCLSSISCAANGNKSLALRGSSRGPGAISQSFGNMCTGGPGLARGHHSGSSGFLGSAGGKEEGLAPPWGMAEPHWARTTGDSTAAQWGQETWGPGAG